ncbi:MAG: UDP-N-acetylglucosamine 1-carboxyvinyltransferase [Eubacteriales bacterium]|nr:UDP-N-acetylglucosamine 1-carboxyvinyltransferase [Eubacteriales bacterium]
MGWIEITGGTPLHGKVRIQGSKNAALPILAGAILHQGRTVIENCPVITDVLWTIRILEELGCVVRFEKNRLEIDSSKVQACRIPGELGSRMRSSVIFLGSLLGRMKKAWIPYPGGCTIGKRPLDLHQEALEALGAVITEEDGFLRAETSGLEGAVIRFGFPSVGATENAILGAVLAKGVTTIFGAAMEPEIWELCRFLNEKGAKITWMKRGEIRIEGVKRLQDSRFVLTADRIVAGTYLFGAIATRGRVFLEDAPGPQMREVLRTARLMGAQAEESKSGLWINAEKAFRSPEFVRTAPYPGFPTDLQSPLLTAASLAKGKTAVQETIFESRFQTASQLRKMGAQIAVEGNRALITGTDCLHGACVEARELRGGAALILAGLAAKGVTQVRNTEYISRGYEDICRDLRCLGAKLKEGFYSDST